ncbi:restriction modification system DNA specificity domain-containing protein [Actinobacillus suis H91-0380]|uniref:Restriction modification system DNA specificity domain-containing protein n=5 Tax=Actinobacillus suis TaxID=716 RepID=K0G3S3_ACTSU|nr:restriction modification system DNA specificity domain-containing protein [Actinobacillus suis H91-0380]
MNGRDASVASLPITFYNIIDEIHKRWDLGKNMNDWKLTRLSDVADIIGGGTPKSSEDTYFNGDISWITPKDLSGYNYRYISKGERNITELGLKNSSAKLLPKGSVLFTSRAPIGYVAIAKNELATNQGFKSLVLKEGHIPEFYYYLLKHNVPLLEARSTGSTFKEISGQVLKDTELKIPNYEIQKNIVDILSPIDEKIELNTQTNQTLEQIAQAIFKSWFVDFEPVKAKMQGGNLAAMEAISGKNSEELHRLQTENPTEYQKLWAIADAFPDEIGEDGVPVGWEVTSFGEVSECFDKRRIPLSKHHRAKRKGNIPYYGATSVMDYVDESIFDDIYLLIGEDGSVLKEDGTPFIQYIWGKSWVNNHAHVLQGKNGVSTEQLMIFMSLTNIKAYVTGAVQMKLNQANMNSIPFIKANNEINDIFNKLIMDFYKNVRNLSDENKKLISIRDLLLPKLLNGDLLNAMDN